MHGHVAHLTVELLVEPAEEPGLCIRQINTGNADLLEPEFSSPAPNISDQLFGLLFA